MSQIGVSYTPSLGTPVYNILFKQFADDTIARSYAASATLNFAVNGTATMTGPAYSQKRIWAVSAVVSKQTAADLDAMYRAWDQDRATGLAAAVGINDQTFGAAVVTSAVFSTPPSYSRFGPLNIMVSFGLTEV
jgi:hypothetical protein